MGAELTFVKTEAGRVMSWAWVSARDALWKGTASPARLSGLPAPTGSAALLLGVGAGGWAPSTGVSSAARSRGARQSRQGVCEGRLERLHSRADEWQCRAQSEDVNLRPAGLLFLV